MTSENWFPVPDGELTGLFEPYLRAAQVEFNGGTVAESSDVMLLRDGRLQGEIHFMFSEDEVNSGVLTDRGRTEQTEKGELRYWDVQVDEAVADDAAFAYPNEPLDGRPDLRGYIGFEWDAMDAWYDEGQRIYKHPRDPYHRIDTVTSSREIRIELDGTPLATSEQPVILYETGLPRRYYLRREDVDMDRLRPSDTTWHCPYKGEADFWSIEVDGDVYEDLAWAYSDPFKDASEVRDMICFYNEKVDVYLDDELEGTPRTRFA